MPARPRSPRTSRRTGDARPACRAAGCRPAGFIADWTQPQKPARLCHGCSAPWVRTRNAAPGSAQNSPGGPITSSSTGRRGSPPGASRCWRPSAADPGAAQPYDLWASTEMVALIREAQVFGLRCARPSSSIGASVPPSSGAKRARRRRAAASALRAGSASAHRVRRQRGCRPACTRDGADSAAAREITALVDEPAAVADMTAKPPPNSKTHGKARRYRRTSARESARRGVDSPGRC